MGSLEEILAGYDASRPARKRSILRTGTEALTTAALAWLARK
jgi:hypothetical protein